MRVAIDDDLESRRDPETIRAYLPRLAFFFEHWHRATIEGLDDVPEGATLLVGNHNGGAMSPDMFALMVAWWRRFGVDTRAYGLMHDLPFRVPWAGDLMARLGAVPAHPDNAVELLRRGAKVLVYPGGDLDAYRPWSKKGEIIFGRRSGFIRVALRTGSPIVPVVSCGAHDSFRVLTDGRGIVERLGLKRRARLDVFPIALCLPWGLTIGPAIYLPLPVDIEIQLLPPLRWPELAPEAADDDAIVWRCREQVRDVMQTALDAMERRRRGVSPSASSASRPRERQARFRP